MTKSSETATNKWETEYRSKGIPSSFRETPTRIVALFVEKYNDKGNALDLGCGKGRNSLFLSRNGYRVCAVDFVPSVVDELKAKAEEHSLPITMVCQSVADPLPFPDDHFDLVIDIFCYKHQIGRERRRRYREEIARVLKPSGFFVLSLAGVNDGFYGPLLAASPDSENRVVIDPHTHIASVLFTREDVEQECAGFETVEYIPTSDESPMHGKVYLRETVNFIMQKR